MTTGALQIRTSKYDISNTYLTSRRHETLRRLGISELVCERICESGWTEGCGCVVWIVGCTNGVSKTGLDLNLLPVGDSQLILIIVISNLLCYASEIEMFLNSTRHLTK